MINFADRKPLKELHQAYMDELTAQGKSRAVVLGYCNPVRQLIAFLDKQNISSPVQVKQEHLIGFQQYLYDERDFTSSSVKTFLKHVRLFMAFVIKSGELTVNVAVNLQILSKPEPPQKQLAHFYTFEEIIRRYMGNEREWVSYGYLNILKKHLNGFIRYLKSNNLKSVYVVTEKTLLEYREYLWNDYVYHRQDSLVVKSQIHRLRAVVRLFRYLYKEGILKDNPAQHLDWENYYKKIAQEARTLPKQVIEHKDLTQLDELMNKFLQYELARNKSEKTVRQYAKAVRVFFDYLNEKGIQNLTQITKRLLSEYFIYLCNYIGVRGNHATNGYKNHLLWGVKLFFRYLVRADYLSKDPCLDLESIKEDRGLPHAYMNEREVFEIMNKPRLDKNPLNCRDRAILKVLFSTGIRCNELANLNLEDIDYQHEMLRVNVPKGGARYQRIIPIDSVTLESVKLYLTQARPLIENGDGQALFLSYRGHRLNNEGILNIVKRYAFECGFRKKITTHSFRVTCATLLHRNGADIRYIQEQLGHKQITSTQIYTRLMPVDLKSIHRKCHPLALDRKKTTDCS